MCCPCCVNTLNLGCFAPCALVFNAGVVGIGNAGVWSLRLNFGRSFLLFDVTLAEGDPIDSALNNINENYIQMIIERVCAQYEGTFESLITNNKSEFTSLKSDKTELEWLESVDNFSAFLKMVFLHYPHTSSAMIVRSNCMDQN